MPVTRHNADFNSTIEWTKTVNELPNTTSFLKSKGLFNANFTNQESILFDRIQSEVRLLPDANRRGGTPSVGKDEDVSTIALPLGYFKHEDKVTKQDVMSKRRAGTADQEALIAEAIAKKLSMGRISVDQTHEYMMLQAIKGSCVTPQGRVLANMFTEFGVTQKEVDFDLSNATALGMEQKIGEVKDHVAKNLKTGGLVTGPLEILCDRLFFEKFISNSAVQAAYFNSQSNIVYQQELATYHTWGISDVFTHRDIRLVVYSHEFVLPDGTTQKAIEDNTGYVVPQVSGEGIFEAYYGPSQRMDMDGGMEMFAYEFRDPRQMYHDLTFETAPLFIGTRPLTAVKVTTSS